MMTSKVEIEPANDDRHSTVKTHCDKKQSGVLELGVFMDGDEDPETNNRHTYRKDGEGESVFGKVRKSSDNHGEGEGASPGRDAMQLGPNRRVMI